MSIFVKKFIGAKFDRKLTFDHYVKNLCKRATTKLTTLVRFVPCMGLAKKNFFTAQVNYCPLIWIIHSRSNNTRVKCLHERFLRLI